MGVVSRSPQAEAVRLELHPRLTTPEIVRASTYRFRWHLAPLAAWPAAWAVHATGTARPMLEAGVALGATAAALAFRRTGRTWRYRWCAAAGLWAGADVLAGGLPPRLSMLAWLGLSIPWWVAVQVRPEPEAPAPDPAPRMIEELKREWARRIECRGGNACWCQRYVAPGVELPGPCKGGVLPGVTLTDVVPIPGVPKGLSGALTSTDFTLPEIQQRMQRLLVVLRLPAGSIEFASDPERSDKSRIFITPINPLRTVEAFDGPTLARGSYRFGPSLAGPGALVRIDDPDTGPIPVVIAGAQGSGKSGTTKGLLTELHLSPVHVTWLIDPQQGASHPEYRGVVDWFAGDMDTARMMLRAAVRVMEARERFMANLEHEVTVDLGDGELETMTVKGVDVFAPRPGLPMMTPEFPEVRIVVEEAPVILGDPEMAQLVAAILKRGRKTGVSVVLISQLLAQTEFGDPAVRPLVTSGTRIVHRTSDTLAGRQASGGTFTVNPSAMPQTWPDGTTTAGLAYVQSGGDDPVLARARWTGNWWSWARRPRAGLGLDALSVRAVNEDVEVYGRTAEDVRAEAQLAIGVDVAPRPSLGLPQEKPQSAPELMLAAIRAAGEPLAIGEWMHRAGVQNPNTGKSARDKLLVDKVVRKIDPRTGRSQDIRYEAVEGSV